MPRPDAYGEDAAVVLSGLNFLSTVKQIPEKFEALAGLTEHA
jgi:hypothetical protein